MQIATMLNLAGSITCVGIFFGQKKWVLAAAFICSVAYTLLDKVVHVAALPALAVEALPFVFLVLVVYEVITKLVMK